MMRLRIGRLLRRALVGVRLLWMDAPEQGQPCVLGVAAAIRARLLGMGRLVAGRRPMDELPFE